MKSKASEKSQRIVAMSDNYVIQRKRMAYAHASELIHGKVLLVGAEKSLDISLFASKARTLTIVDKVIKDLSHTNLTNVEYHFAKFPSLSGLTSNSFDFVLSFQAIEHIPDDFMFMHETRRVLKPGGHLIITTPNKLTSLTRNPWHRREYSVDEFKNLLSSYFQNVDAQGVYARDNVMEYYEKNKKSVRAFARLDLLNLHKFLPNALLKLPYHLLNKINRRKLLVENRTLTLKITKDDFFLAKASDSCFDLFFIAQK